jgi:hypothetical protein
MDRILAGALVDRGWWGESLPTTGTFVIGHARL